MPSALPSAWGQSAHWSWLGDDYASTLLYRKYNYNDYTTYGSLYIAYTCREFTLGYFRNGLPRGWAAEAWAARRWRAPFRSTSLRAEEPAANDAAGPKNGQAGKVAWRGIGPLRARRFPRPTPARARRGGWEGPCQISRPTARFLPETASRRETRTTHRPTSYEPLLPNFVSDRRRPRGERCPTLRWPDRLETAPKKTIVGHFAWFLAVFSARRAAFAAAFFAMRRPTAGAQPGLPLGARPCSAMLVQSESQAGPVRLVLS